MKNRCPYKECGKVFDHYAGTRLPYRRKATGVCNGCGNVMVVTKLNADGEPFEVETEVMTREKMGKVKMEFHSVVHDAQESVHHQNGHWG